MEFNIKRIVSLIVANLKYIILIALVFALLFFGFTKLFIAPSYTSEVELLIVPKGELSKTTEASFIKMTINDYKKILSADIFYAKVAEKYNSASPDELITVDDIKRCTSVVIPDTESNSISIKVTTSDAEFSCKLAGSISDRAIEEMLEYKEKYGYNEIAKFDGPSLPVAPSSPNVIQNVVIGFAFGIIACIALLILKEFFDVRIKNVEDLTEKFDIPVLGVIPDTATKNPNSRKNKKAESEKEA